VVPVAAAGQGWWQWAVAITCRRPCGHRATGAGARWLAMARRVAAGIFLGFGVTKFSHHASELASFRRYPPPAPGVVVYLVGVLEIGGGLLPAAGLLTRLAALALAADMVGAVVVSGWRLGGRQLDGGAAAARSDDHLDPLRGGPLVSFNAWYRARETPP